LSQANAALLVPPRAEPLADALSRLEKDRELLRALGDRGRMWTEKNCSPERAGTRFLEFYQTILNQHQRKSP
jgi:glycosyltransferase involved in cell wall biosynthesis